MLDHALSHCLDRALAELSSGAAQAPACTEALLRWTTGLSSTGRARDYFEGGRAVMLLLPWWLEKRVRAVPDVDFQQPLVESTVNAYYFVRLIDNVMDDHAPADRQLLPLLGLFQANFSRAYARLFSTDHPFWNHFDRHWAATCEAALREKRLTTLSRVEFEEIAARKTSGIKIPLAAVCCRYDRLDLLDSWCAFYDRFACWQQMLDDTFDWMRDLRGGHVTFFLSEGMRQKARRESISGWVVRRGFAWGISELDASMQDLMTRAAHLESPELVRFLEYRHAEIRERSAELMRQLIDVARLANVFEPLDGETAQSSRSG